MMSAMGLGMGAKGPDESKVRHLFLEFLPPQPPLFLQASSGTVSAHSTPDFPAGVQAVAPLSPPPPQYTHAAK